MALWGSWSRSHGDGGRRGGMVGARRADRPGHGGAPDRSVALERPAGRTGTEAAPYPVTGRDATAEAAPGRSANGRAGGSTAGSGQRSKACRNARIAAGAIGLPARAHRCDRHRPQHSRYPWSRRLRRRGSGAARGRGAGGQAAGCAETRSDPPLRDGVGGRGLDSQRYRAAHGVPRQRRQRSRQFRLVRMPWPQPRRRRQTVRAWPRQRARCAGPDACQRRVDRVDRPHGSARAARKRAAFGLRAIFNGARAGLRRLP